MSDAWNETHFECSKCTPLASLCTLLQPEGSCATGANCRMRLAGPSGPGVVSQRTRKHRKNRLVCNNYNLTTNLHREREGNVGTYNNCNPARHSDLTQLLNTHKNPYISVLSALLWETHGFSSTATPSLWTRSNAPRPFAPRPRRPHRSPPRARCGRECEGIPLLHPHRSRRRMKAMRSRAKSSR